MKSEDKSANFALLRFAAGAVQRRTLIVGLTMTSINKWCKVIH